MPDPSHAALLPESDGAKYLADDNTDAFVPRIRGYEIKGRLGHGGMGTVWRAIQLGTSREVAIKLMSERLFASENARDWFQREVRLHARLNHPHIARIYDSGLDQGFYYYAMELVDGLPLDRYVQEHHLPVRRMLELFRQVCLAVQHAHQLGVIHLDLKPSNILVTKDGQPRVLDFGLAQALENEEMRPDGVGEPVSPLPSPGSTGSPGRSRRDPARSSIIAGTPAYMAPEQVTADGSSTTRADVYALGVILYKLTTGRMPFELSGSYELDRRRIATGASKPPRQVNRSIHVEVEAIIRKAMQKEEDRRYSSPGELAEDIRRHLSGEAVPARSRSTLYTARKWIVKHRVKLAFIGMLFLLAAFAVGYQQVLRVKQLRESQRREMELRGWDQNRTGTALLPEGRPGGALAAFDSARDLILATNPAATLELDVIAWNRRQAAPPPLMTLAGHAGGTRAIVLLPDGKHAVSGGANGKLCHWHLPTGQLVGLPVMADPVSVNALALSRDGKTLLSGGSDGVMKVWSLSPQLTLNGSISVAQSHGPIHSIAIDQVDSKASRALTAHNDGAVVLWDLQSQSPIREMAAHQKPATCVAFVPGTQYFVTLGQDQKLLRWSLAAQTLGENIGFDIRPGCHQFAVGTDEIGGPLTLSQTIGLATELGSIGMLAKHRGEPDPEYMPATAFAMPLNASEAVIGYESGAIKLWQFGNPVGCFRLYLAHDRPIRALVMQSGQGPYRRLMLSGGDDGAIRVWDLGRIVARESRLMNSDGWVARQLSFSADGRMVLATGETGSQRLGPGRLVDLTTGRLIRAIDQGSGVSGIDQNGNVVIYNAPVSAVPPGPPAPRATSKVDPNQPDRTPGYLSADLKKAICVWPDGQSLQVIDTESSSDRGTTIRVGSKVRQVVLSRDGATLLAGCEDGTVRAWNLSTHLPLWKRPAHRGSVNTVAISDDGSWALSGGEDGKLLRWDLKQVKFEPLNYTRGPLSSVAIHPSGRIAAVASRADRTAQIWRVPPEAIDASELTELGSEGGMVSAVGFAPLADRVVVVGCDLGGAMRIWDVSAAAAIARRAGSIGMPPSASADLVALAQWYRDRRRSDWAAEVLQLARDRGQKLPHLLPAQCALDGADGRSYGNPLSAERSATLLKLAGPPSGDWHDAYFRESVGGPPGPALIFRPQSGQSWPASMPSRVPDLRPADRDLLAGATLPESWQRQANGVEAPNVETARLWLGDPQPGEYAVDVWFTRISGNDLVGVTIPVGVVGGMQRHLEVVAGMYGNTLIGLRFVDGMNADANAFAFRNPANMINGVMQHVRVEVRGSGATVWMNGVLIGQLDDYNRLTPISGAPSAGVGLLAKSSGVVFHAVRSSPLESKP